MGKNKVIKYIQIYRSQIENIDGNSHPEGFYNPGESATAFRISMKLRENGFSFGDFDVLYINLTTCKVEGKMAPAKRSADRYHPRYRYYDVEISQELYDSLLTAESVPEIINLTEKVLITFFSSEQFDSARIKECVSEAVEKGEKMTVRYKEKVGSKNKAVVYLRYSGRGRYLPLLRVYDLEDNPVYETDLPETHSLDAYGEIQLSAKKVIIKPRKNAFAEDLEPMTFTFG